MTASQLTLLIRKYLSGEATEEEKAQVERWYESYDVSSIEFAEGNAGAIDESMAKSLEAIKEKIAQQEAETQQERMMQPGKVRKIRWRKVAAAAAVILVFISGTVYFLTHKTNKQQAAIAVQPVKKDIQPGGNKAVLTLGNGQKIVLDSSYTGLLSVQGVTKVIKLNNGKLAYNSEPKAKSLKLKADGQKLKVLYNTITTPRGGQYEVVLPDGSKVWLNAASSIRFPTVFTGKERKVEITGEAYFEVAKNVNMPFEVTVKGVTVNVLGTHFNIMAYNDEETIKTTLLEGSVKVTSGNNALLLKPGQQARVKQNGKMELVKDINVNETVAWQNNLFWFENDSVQEVMRQLSRWYDVDIIIRGNIPDLFTGSIPRNITFSRIFEVLQKTGSMHYKITDNKTIVVTP